MSHFFDTVAVFFVAMVAMVVTSRTISVASLRSQALRHSLRLLEGRHIKEVTSNNSHGCMDCKRLVNSSANWAQMQHRAKNLLSPLNPHAPPPLLPGIRNNCEIF
jgi:hypothetical protein